jgi:S1-C subfamily serine protease
MVEDEMKNLKGRILVILGVVLITGAAFWAGSSFSIVPRTALAAPVLYDQNTVTGIYDSVNTAIVEIIAQAGSGRMMSTGQGSGFLVDDKGHILTNNHVVSGAATVQVILSGGKTVDGKVAGTDIADDLAIVTIDPAAVTGIKYLKLADSNSLKSGQMVIAIGSPYGMFNSVSVGVISGLNRSMNDSSSSLSGLIQTDASLNPGNSGGPLLDTTGAVIGINTAYESNAKGIGFAVPSSTAARVLSALIAGQQVTRAWMGISGTSLTATNAASVGLKVTQGVYVISVVTSSPADKAGLKGSGVDANGNPQPGGDVITAVDGKTLASLDDLQAYLGAKMAGDKISLTILRADKNVTVQLTLESKPAAVVPTAQVKPGATTRPTMPALPTITGAPPTRTVPVTPTKTVTMTVTKT